MIDAECLKFDVRDFRGRALGLETANGEVGLILN